MAAFRPVWKQAKGIDKTASHPRIERTCTGRLRQPPRAAHVQCCTTNSFEEWRAVMKKIRISRVVLGGLIASIAYIFIEFIFEGFLGLAFDFNEATLARQYFPDMTLSGTRFQIVNILYLISICTLTVWIYAMILPKTALSLKSSITASLTVIFVIILFLINHINMGIYPVKPALISLCFSLIEFPPAIIAGTNFYKTNTKS
jgi:hypothetical protein